MKTNSLSFSSAWGLAVASIAPWIIGTQFLTTPAAGASTAHTIAEPVLVLGDNERVSHGIIAYEITADNPSHRWIEVIGSSSGTIEITGGDNSTVFEVVCDQGTVPMQLTVWTDSGYGEVTHGGNVIGHWANTQGDVYSVVGFDQIAETPEWALLTHVLMDSNLGIRSGAPQEIALWLLLLPIAATLAVAWIVMRHGDLQHRESIDLTHALHCASQNQCCYEAGDDPSVPCCDEFFNNCSGTSSHKGFCEWLGEVCSAAGGFGGACDDYDAWCSDYGPPQGL